jgi:hypothetical protein
MVLDLDEALAEMEAREARVVALSHVIRTRLAYRRLLEAVAVWGPPPGRLALPGGDAPFIAVLEDVTEAGAVIRV